MTKPSDRASELMSTVDHAHARLERAWKHRPDGDLQTGRPETGRIVSSRIPDPASDAAATHERLRADVMATVCELTADLAAVDAIDANPALVFRARRLKDVLALHGQYAGQLLTRIRSLEADPTAWDDAKSLTGTLASHAQQIDRTSRWAYGMLVQPDADATIDVCEGERCQRAVVVAEGPLCPECQARADRRQAKAEQRRRQVRADREAGIRCHGELGRMTPDGKRCEALLSDTDRARNRRHCGACRTDKSRKVGTGGTFTWQETR